MTNFSDVRKFNPKSVQKTCTVHMKDKKHRVDCSNIKVHHKEKNVLKRKLVERMYIHQSLGKCITKVEVIGMF